MRDVNIMKFIKYVSKDAPSSRWDISVEYSIDDVDCVDKINSADDDNSDNNDDDNSNDNSGDDSKS